MHIYGVALGALTIQIVVYQPRLIVALKGEHHLQVVAKVVLRQVVAQWQLALVVTSNHATNQFHLSGILEQYSCHISREMVTGRSLIPATVQELMAFLDCLDGIVVWQHAEREVTLIVGLH